MTISSKGLAALGALVLTVVMFPAPADTQDAIPLTAEQLKARWHGRLDSQHFTAQIRLEMELAGLREVRRLSVFRDDEAGDSERVMIRFETPADLRRVAVLYLEHSDRPNDYFIYQPATRRVRRLPASIADDDVYGIDLEFLGFGVAQNEPTRTIEVSRERLGNRATYRIIEGARLENPRFTRRITWIDATNFIPIRTEHFRKKRLVLIAETLEVSLIQGVPTPIEMRFSKPGEKRFVRLVVESVDYETGLAAEAFSIMNLARGR
ncbi:MAG: outer membrane lipoprotein-sorting protein [bacterium]|nr:outer membrane lipoprotein-sorting protein [bacterium]